MINGNDCGKKYGYPVDLVATTVNEETEFQKNWMVLWDIPSLINLAIPALPNKLYCNSDIIRPLDNAFNLVIEKGLAGEIKTWDGCYNVRPIRGYEKKFQTANKDKDYLNMLKYLSIHSWGIAFDINAAWNGLGQVPTMSKELVKCFTDSGFDWGGNFTRKDGMHFQLSQL